MARKKHSEETCERAAEMREEGFTYKQIGDELGMSQASVYWHCLRLGADSPTSPPKTNIGPLVTKRGDHTVRRFTPEEDAKMLEMEQAGATRSDIARALGRRHNSVIGRLLTLARKDERESRL